MSLAESVWNWLQNPFYNFMKWNSYSVSQFFSIFF